MFEEGSVRCESDEKGGIHGMITVLNEYVRRRRLIDDIYYFYLVDLE